MPSPLPAEEADAFAGSRLLSALLATAVSALVLLLMSLPAAVALAMLFGATGSWSSWFELAAELITWIKVASVVGGLAAMWMYSMRQNRIAPDGD